MIVYWVLGFQLNGPVVALDGFLILLQRVVGCPQISMIGRYLRVEGDCLLNTVYFLLMFTQLSERFALVVPELALFGQIETDIATPDDVIPLL